MSWKKLGNIFTPDKQHNWINSHASLPTPYRLDESRFRIYFSSRDLNGHSHIGYLNFDIEELNVTSISNSPILSPGPKGSFDENGLSMGCIVEINNKPHLYYVGWGKPIDGKFNNTIGLAYWDSSQERFIKSTSNPILALDKIDPLNLSYPFVMKVDHEYIMWYGTNHSWADGKDKMHHSLRTARSSNGLHWIKDKNIALDLKHKDEFAILRPTLVNFSNLYRMWYCYKGSSYKIGYAESVDTLLWNRKDNVSIIEKDSNGWASDEVCYPYVFEHKDKLYMLYNGNSYGKTGFGLAVWN